jgi:2-amino-4-hydroxy-6-hydroxymethyldihydropteridine diphosphokinase
VTLAYFSLGSNRGDRAAYLRRGVQLIVGDDAHRLSDVYETDPWGPVAQDDFLNLILEMETSQSPRELLELIRLAEADAHRERQVHWGPRTLDVDLIYMDGVTSDDPDIIVPHPRWRERAFVLVPLRELRPDLVPDNDVDPTSGEVRLVGRLSDIG